MIMEYFHTIDWGIVRKDCRQMGLIFMATTTAFYLLPIEADANRTSTGFLVGLAIWLYGLRNQKPSQ